MRLTAADLFSGAGGSSLGFKLAGFDVVAALESDPVACRTYEHNFGLAPLCKRIEAVAPEEFMAHFGLRRNDLTVLVGCPPCQGFSQARRCRASNGHGETDCMEDPRNQLVDVFAEWVQALMPAFVVFENVPGILRRGRERFERLIGILRGTGYEPRWAVLDAADYGVAQRRKRLVVVAPRREIASASELEFPPAREGMITVREAIGHLPPLQAGEAHPSIPNHRARSLGKRALELVKRIPADGGSRADVPRHYWLRCHRESRGHQDVFGRLRWEDVAPTLTTGCTDPTRGRFVHPEQHRALTAREAAILQSFPEDFVFLGGEKDIAKQIGNAFPPRMMQAVALSIRKCYEGAWSGVIGRT